MPQVPLLPQARNLPNQVDILGPTQRAGSYNVNAAAGLMQAADEINQINQKVMQEERKVSAAYLLSQAKIRQNAAVEMSEQIEDPDTYVSTVDATFATIRKELNEATKGNRRLNNMVMVGLAGQEALASDDVYRRHSRLRNNKVERQLNETIAAHAQDVAMQPLEVREQRAKIIEDQLNADRYFRPQSAKMVRQFQAQADEARINALINGHPNKPDFKDPATALEELRIDRTPYLSPEKRNSLYKEANTVLDKQEREGKKLNKDQVDAKMIELQNQIFGTEKIPDDQVIANALDAVNKRLLDPKNGMDQVHQWLGQRRNGVTGSKEARNNFMNDFYSPATGALSVGKVAKYQRIILTTPMDAEDKAYINGRLFAIGQSIIGANRGAAFLDIAEDNAGLADTMNFYNTFFDKLPFGSRSKIEQLWADQRAKGVPIQKRQENILREVPPTSEGGKTKVKDVGGVTPGQPSSGRNLADKILQDIEKRK